MMDRDYDWSTFTKASLYGVPTPHDNSGTGVGNALHWLHIARRYVGTSDSSLLAFSHTHAECMYVCTYVCVLN